MKYFCLAFLLFILGCTSEISLNQNEYQPKIVVDGWIEPNEPAIVFLTQSSPFLTQYDSVSIVKSFLNHAKVSIYCSNGEEEILTLFKIKDHFPPYVYKTTQLTGTIGQSYSLKIEYNGNILMASTTIPKPPQIESIAYKEHSKFEGSLIVKYIPQDVNLPYYIFQTNTKNSNHWLLPTYYPIQIYSSDMGKIAEYEIFKGRDNNISNTDIFVPEADSVGARYYGVKDTIFVSVSSLDTQSFEVLNSIFFSLSNYDNPFTVSNPALTNINGGLGRWTGLGTSRVIFNSCSKDSSYIRDK